jgi:NAD(P)H-dependent flavin oxidoreductase YrpB (nitropropane dioxygenase family)
VSAPARRRCRGAGSRFLLTHQCHAHPAYQQRVIEATQTVRTRLFGLRWRRPNRVVANAAVRRWCHDDGRGRARPAALMTATMPLARHVPLSWAGPFKRLQRVGVPLFGPAPLLRGDDARHQSPTARLQAAALRSRSGSVASFRITRADAARRWPRLSGADGRRVALEGDVG